MEEENKMLPAVEIKDLQKREKRKIRDFKINFVRNLPSELKAKYKKLRLREKLFLVYYFDSPTITEAALKAGFKPAGASTRASACKRKVGKILEWIEERFVEEVGSRIGRKNIISREVILDKLARMYLPNLSHFEDLEKAKKMGMFDAVHELEYENVYNEREGKVEKKVKKIKLHDPVKTAGLICKMLGYESAQKQEVNHIGAPNGEQPQINIQINMVESDGEK